MCIPFRSGCQLEPLSLQLQGSMWLVLLTALLFFVFLFLAARYPRWALFGLIRSPGFAALVIVVLLGLFVVGFIAPVAFPRRLGEIWIIILFFALLLFALIFLLHSFAGRLIFTGLVVLALLGAWLDSNDNHEIRLIAHGAPVSSGLDGDFKAWLDSRQDRHGDDQRPYPVYVVAAEGGGIYAAYHAAMVLARLQDQCPNFAQHVFAISSVSGGSLGAAVFRGLAEQMARNDGPRPCQRDRSGGPFEERTHALLTEDHLSPAIWGLLFPDFLQTFIPFPIGGLDRARWLERSFESSWLQIQRSNYFAQPLLRSYDRAGAAPAILMNTTEVATGQRIVLTGFPLDGVVAADGVTTINSFLNTRVWDLPISTAVGLSARFPVLSPAGLVPGGTGARLVDGGYFENSGAETALDLIRLLNRIAAAAHVPIAVRLIVMETASEDRPSRAFSGIRDPVTTMLNTRVTRGTLARVRAWRELCNACGPVTIVGDAVLRVTQTGATPAAEPVIWHGLDAINKTLPLGWRLGHAAQDDIRAQVGGAADCKPAAPSSGRLLFGDLNDCAFTQVADEIERGVDP